MNNASGRALSVWRTSSTTSSTSTCQAVSRPSASPTDDQSIAPRNVEASHPHDQDDDHDDHRPDPRRAGRARPVRRGPQGAGLPAVGPSGVTTT